MAEDAELSLSQRHVKLSLSKSVIESLGLNESQNDYLDGLTLGELANHGYEALETAVETKAHDKAVYASNVYNWYLSEKLKTVLPEIDREKEGELYDRLDLEHEIGCYAAMKLRASTCYNEESSGPNWTFQEKGCAKEDLIKAIEKGERSESIKFMAQSMARAGQFPDLLDVMKYVREKYSTPVVSK
jgi:hypothetical protein